jgi:methionyl-tRNA formyltransferase
MVRLAFAAVRVVEQLLGGLVQYGADLPLMPQDEGRAHYFPRPTPGDLTIRWETQSGDRVRALVKASNPWNNGAFTSVRGLELRITDVTLRPGAGDPGVPPGTVLIAAEGDGLIVNCCGGSALVIDVVSMDEGILPGRTLAVLGIGAGERFVTMSER